MHEEIQTTSLQATKRKEVTEKKKLWKKGSKNFHKYVIGDMLMLKVNKKDNRLENKLSLNYIGTCEIIEENPNK